MLVSCPRRSSSEDRSGCHSLWAPSPVLTNSSSQVLTNSTFSGSGGVNVWVSTQLNGPSGGEKGWLRGMKSRGRGGRTFPTLEPAAGKAGWPKSMVCLGLRCHKHRLTWAFFTAWLLSSCSGSHRGKDFVPSLLDPPAHLPHCPEDPELVRQGLPHLPRPEPKTDLCSHSPRTLL